MNDKIAVKVQNISKTFKPRSRYPVHALKDVSFVLKEGEVTGLIGPNGAGKTTLLRIILGFIKADTGVISIFDDTTDSIETRTVTGYQADSNFTSKYIKVNGFLELNSSLLGTKDNTKQIRSLLEHFNMTFTAHKSLSSLSKGMRQKIELIQAFLGNPKIVFLDEPTASLDPLSVLELRDYIEEKKKTGITILFSSHNLAEVEKICDRVLFIHDGKIFGDYYMDKIEPGFLEEAFRKYQSERNEQ